MEETKNEDVGVEDLDNAKVEKTTEDSVMDEEQQQQQQAEPLSDAKFRMACFAMCFSSFLFGYIPLQLSSYAPFMVFDLLPGLEKTKVGAYTGLLNSALLMGRAISAYFWTSMSDEYGRKGVLLFAVVAAAIMSVLFGMSQTLWQALLTRFVGGLLDGGGRALVRVMSIEYAGGNQQLQTTILSYDVMARALGMILGPALSGFLAEPLTQYPDSAWLQDSSFVPMLTRYPFILPNLFTALVCLLTLLVLWVWADETLESSKIKSIETIPTFLAQQMASYWGVLTCQRKKVEPTSIGDDSDKPTSTVAPGESTHLIEKTSDATQEQSIMSDKALRDHTIAYWVGFVFLVATVEAVPLFFISPVGGLGLQENQTGLLLGSRGLWLLFIQVFLLKPSIAKLGLYGSMRWSTVCYYGLTAMPLGLLFSGPPGTVNVYTVLFYCGFIWWSFTYFACLFYVSMLVAINKLVSDSHRAKINGTLSVGENFGFGLAPLYAGVLYNWCYEAPGDYSAIIYWTILGLLQGLICQYLFCPLKPRENHSS